jgi:AcrR family transcriptional regulator
VPHKTAVITLGAAEVDYDRRRREIARVIARLWAARGERACTMRTVAAELGTSMTVITRAFASRAEMMRFTREAVLGEWAAATDAALAAETTPSGKLRALLLQQCPIDERTLADGALWLQTLAPQHRDEDLIAGNRRFNDELLATAEPLLEELGVDRSAARLLMVAVYGLNAAAVEDPAAWTFERVEQALDDILCRFGIESRECVGGRGSVADHRLVAHQKLVAHPKRVADQKPVTHQRRVAHEKPVAHRQSVTEEKPVVHQQPEEG